MLALGRGRNSPSERPRGTAGDRNTCEVCTWSLGTQHLPALLMSLEGYPPTLLPHWLTSPSKNNNGTWVERSETGYLWVQRHAKPKGRGMRSRHWRQKKQLRFTARATQSQDSNPDSIAGTSTHPIVQSPSPPLPSCTEAPSMVKQYACPASCRGIFHSKPFCIRIVSPHVLFPGCPPPKPGSSPSSLGLGLHRWRAKTRLTKACSGGIPG